MQLFREGERTNDSRILPGQTKFDWLHESSHPDSHVARMQVQEAFDHLPVEHQCAYAKKLRGGDGNHVAAVVELFAHEMFCQAGFDVELEPQLSGGSRPDFLLKHGAFRCYAEVTVDTGNAARNKKQSEFDRLCMEAGRTVKSTGFCFAVEGIKDAPTQVPPRRFAAFLDNWFGSLDHHIELEKSQRGDFNELSKETFKDSNWTITLRAFPLPDPQTKPSQLCAAIQIDAGRSEAESRLAENIREKLTQHKGDDIPLLIIVGTNEWFSEPEAFQIANVLYGSAPTCPPAPSLARLVVEENPKATWNSVDPRKNHRLHGVVILRKIFPWTFGLLEPELWERPLYSIEDRIVPWPFRRFEWTPATSKEVRCVDGLQGVLKFTTLSNPARSGSWQQGEDD